MHSLHHCFVLQTPPSISGLKEFNHHMESFVLVCTWILILTSRVYCFLFYSVRTNSAFLIRTLYISLSLYVLLFHLFFQFEWVMSFDQRTLAQGSEALRLKRNHHSNLNIVFNFFPPKTFDVQVNLFYFCIFWLIFSGIFGILWEVCKPFLGQSGNFIYSINKPVTSW